MRSSWMSGRFGASRPSKVEATSTASLDWKRSPGTAGFRPRRAGPNRGPLPHTFATRVFGTRGRREIRPDEERIFFYENPRDPDINAALADACRRLNQCRLSREGRRLRYEMARHDGGQLT